MKFEIFQTKKSNSNACVQSDDMQPSKTNRLSDFNRLPDSSEERGNNLRVGDIRTSEASLPAFVRKGESRVSQTQRVQERRMEVMHVHNI